MPTNEIPTGTVTAAGLYARPNAIAADYSRFRVADRLLLSGHSHQAWPDRALRGQDQAWLDAAELVDRKWDRAFARAERVRDGWRRLLGEPEAEVALGTNTHELVVRLLSALPLAARPRIVTTDGEFHTLRRQLDRLEEEGLQIVRVPAAPSATLAERLAAEIDDRTALAAISSVLFRTAERVPELRQAAAACARHGAELLVDTYHALNAVPFSVAAEGLERAFIVGGGYKYCQLGEGNCFLRVPPDCTLRPVVTGWFAEFDALADRTGTLVRYGRGAARFAGATYDPTAHYRAAEVFDYFEERGLTAGLLREVSLHQVGLLADAFDALDIDPRVIDRDRDLPADRRAGFLAFRSPHAAALSASLWQRGVGNDYRDDILRLGPAPYLNDDQLHEAVSHLEAAVKELT